MSGSKENSQVYHVPMAKNQVQSFELLLPVGQLEMALAAIHNGAHAIYLGFPQFNARGRSHDFGIEELQNIIETCHLYGVKVNLALNIVIFEDELDSIIQALKRVLPLNPDALIIQDLGLLDLVRKLAPEQVVHASTQMTVTNDLAIEFLDDLNIKRFVLGRENSLTEIELIKKNTDRELEVFVHGALCVSYSGQCFTSETIGGRSANRGQCAQSCRFGYELIVDGIPKNGINKDYLLSPKDLCGLDEIGRLMDIGVTSFKVEGRLKTPEYVASAAREFRQAMDLHQKGGDLSSEKSQVAQRNLAANFSRGFHSGWLHGVDHQSLVDGTFSSHRGAPIGQVLKFEPPSSLLVELLPEVTLDRGDGILWAQDQIEWGSFIFSVDHVRDNKYRVGIDNEVFLKSQEGFKTKSAETLWSNSKLYLNHDKNQRKDLQGSFSDKERLKRIPIQVEIELALDQPLVARVSDGRWTLEERTQSQSTLALKFPLSDESLKEEFNSLGGSVFSLDGISITRKSSQPLFHNAKEIKNLRQSLIRRLSAERSQHRVDGENSKLNSDFNLEGDISQSLRALTPVNPRQENSLRFNVLIRTREQAEALVTAASQGEIQVNEFQFIILDFEFGRDTKPALEALRAIGFRVGLATTRILKPQEYGNLKIIAGQSPDMILARNLGAISYFQDHSDFNGEIAGDFSLNVTNHLTASYLLGKGLSTLCLSYDLNDIQVRDILQHGQGDRLEVTVHQFMPSFHMDHCVFAAFLSQGKSFKDCGKPCEKHLVQLKDQFGNLHWIKPDHECRNTMFNAQAQTALNSVEAWLDLGLGTVRYEALYETGQELLYKLKHYRHFFQGKQSLPETLPALMTQERYGLSDGSLSRQHKYQSRKKVHPSQTSST